jgi:hypothetical protein
LRTSLRAVQLQGDGFNILAFRVAQQALQVQFKQGGRFPAPKGRAEQGGELLEFPTDRFDICHAQLALGREGGLPGR